MLLPYLIIAVAALALLNTACVLADFILHRSHKVDLHLRLTGWWLQVFGLEIVDFPRVVAERTLGLKTKVLGQFLWSCRSLAVAVPLSIVLTLAALVGGLRIANPAASYAEVANKFVALFGAHLPVLFVSNLVFDLATVAITIIILERVAAESRALRGSALLLADAVLAFVLAVGCIVGVALLGEAVGLFVPQIAERNPLVFPSLSRDLIGEASAAVVNTTNAVLALGARGARFDLYGLYAVTTFLPTVVYLALMLVLIFAKATLTLGQRAALYSMESVTQVDPAKPGAAKDFKPFTLLGILATLIAAFLMLVVSVSQQLADSSPAGPHSIQADE